MIQWFCLTKRLWYLHHFVVFKPDSTQETTNDQQGQYSERNVNQLSATQTVPLGEYQDVNSVNQTQLDPDNVNDLHSVNFETFNLDSTLAREYPRPGLVWSTSNAAGAVLSKFDPLQSLLTDNAYLADKIKGFKGLTCGIRLSIRTPSTKFVYGKIMACFIPAGYANYVPGNIQEYSGYPHVIISASAGETCVFDIPLIWPYRYIDLEDTYEFGTIRILVLNQLRDISGSANSIELFITTQMLDPKLMLPFTTQSSGSSVPGSSRRPPMTMVSKEAKQKSSLGLIAGIKEEASKVAARVLSSTFTISYRDLFTTATSLASTFVSGLSFPTTLAVTEITKVNPYTDMSYGKGVDHSLKLSMDPSNQVSTDPTLCGIDQDEMSLKVAAATPMLVSTTSFDVTDIGTTFTIDPVTNQTGGTYVDHIVSMFHSYTGSIKYKLYITASDYHSARIVIWFNPSNMNAVTKWSDCYHRVVDIQGDTEVEFTVPYSAVTYAADSILKTGYVYYTVKSVSTPDPTISLPIYVNAYKAAADDIEFYGLVNFIAQSNPRADFHKPFEPIHPSIKSYHQDGVVYGERYTSFREIIHRFNYAGLLDTNTGFINLMFPNLVGTWSGLLAIGTMFAYWRGSVRFKILDSSNYNRVAYVRDDYGATRDFYGVSMNSPQVNPVVEFTVPYYADEAFLFTIGNTSTTPVDNRRIYVSRNPDAPTVDQVAVLKAAGDDFSFLFLRPPINGRNITYNSAAGPQSLYSYYNTPVTTTHN